MASTTGRKAAPGFPLRPLFLLVGASAFVVGVLAGVVPDLRDTGDETYAGLFSAPQTVDLKTNGQDSITGFLGTDNLAPGDASHGTIQLSGNTLLFKHPYDLDIDVSYTLLAGSTNHPEHRDPASFPHLLSFSRLSYGADDLLRYPGRNLTQEIDANPVTGDNDGVLTLYEFQAGVNDLAPPGPHDRPTPFLLTLALADDAGNDIMGTGASITFTFYLAAVQESDLN